MKTKRILTVAAAVLLLLTSLALPAPFDVVREAEASTGVLREEAQPNAPQSGKCGSDLAWSFDSSSGKLTITGTGSMYNYGPDNESPWVTAGIDDKVKTLVLSNGITSIGAYAFYSFSSLTSVVIPGSVSSIGEGAFHYCTSLKSVTIPATVRSVDAYAFYGCSRLKEVDYQGTAAQRNLMTIRSNNTELLNASWRLYSNDVPVVKTQPKSIKVDLGKTVTFKVAAKEASGYQWQRKSPNQTSWSNIGGATSATYSFVPTYDQDGYLFRCVVSNPMGNVYSNAATLTVKYVALAIKTQPKNIKGNDGKVVNFKVKTAGATSIQWQSRKPGSSSWSNVSGAVSEVYSMVASAAYDGYSYRCKVSNGITTLYSNEATLSVKVAVKTQPKALKIDLGKTATFSVTALGATKCQWQYLRPGEKTWNNVSGATSFTYTFTPNASQNGYSYRCMVSNVTGSAYSKAVKLTLQLPLLPPTITKATVDKNTVTLTWTEGSDAKTYAVYLVKGSSGVPTTLVKKGIKGTTFTITGLDKKTTYRFAVTSINGKRESDKSAAVNATTQNRDGIATGRALLISESTFNWDQDSRNHRGIYTIFRNRGDVKLISALLSSVKTSSGHKWSVTTGDNKSNSQIQSMISSTFAAADDDDVSLFMIATHGDSTSTGSAAGALCTYYGTTLYLSDLASWLKKVPGSVIVFLESCGSGAAVNAKSGADELDTQAVIKAFQSADTEISVEPAEEYWYDETGNVVQRGTVDVQNTGEFKVSNKFYVLTAANYLQESWGWEDFKSDSNSYNVFPYYIRMGVGKSGKMPADSNSDKHLTLYELYRYVYQKSIDVQTTRVYPTYSSFVLFTR